MTTDCTPEKDGEVKRVPMMPPGMMTLEILLPQRRSRCWVLVVLHASLCSCCHGSASQHSQVQLWSDVLLQSGQILGLIVLTLVQESPAHKQQTTRGSFHKIKCLFWCKEICTALLCCTV